MSLSSNYTMISPAVLPLMEDFYTLQGEGFYQGKAAYFIRLGGCDVGCHWCDVKDSWDANKFPKVSIDEMVAKVKIANAPIAVVTGGEPLMHDLTSLTQALHENKIKTHIETSGTCKISGEWDWICFSPKKFKEPTEEIFALADELKIIVFNKSDLEWADTLGAQVNTKCHLYLQPEWSQREKVQPLIIEYIKTQPKWRLSLQVHKYLNIP